MSEEEKKEIVSAVLQEIEERSIDATVGFSVDEEGYLCVNVVEG